jgi:protein-S-isoprenylcysteine O-methyltransferase
MKTILARLAALPLIAVLAYLFARGELFSSSPLVITGQLGGVLLILWSRAIFRNQQFRFVPEPGSGALVRSGPYRLIRHPIYAGAMLLVWSSLFAHPSLLNVAIGLIASTLLPIRIAVEEEFLRGHYPDYAEYTRITNRLIPFIY